MDSAMEPEVPQQPPSNRDVALTYYTHRSAKMDDVIKLRPNAPCSSTDLHAITGYDYLSLAQWDYTLEQLVWRYAEPILFPQPTPQGPATSDSAPFAPAVLDAGCGSGAVLDFVMRRYNAENERRGHPQGPLLAYGFDITPSLVEIAAARLPGATIWQGDITAASSYARIPPHSLSLVTCFGVFIHLNSHADACAALSQFYACLRPCSTVLTPADVAHCTPVHMQASDASGGLCFVGYVMDAANEGAAEASRSSSQRRQQFVELLTVVPTYLYCTGRMFRDWGERDPAAPTHLWHTTMRRQLGDAPLFAADRFPNSFRGRCSVYFQALAQGSASLVQGPNAPPAAESAEPQAEANVAN